MKIYDFKETICDCCPLVIVELSAYEKKSKNKNEIHEEITNLITVKLDSLVNKICEIKNSENVVCYKDEIKIYENGDYLKLAQLIVLFSKNKNHYYVFTGFDNENKILFSNYLKTSNKNGHSFEYHGYDYKNKEYFWSSKELK